MPKTYKGRFKPKNPSKYRGDVTKIQYRSSWELRFFSYVDKHPDIVWWASEEIAIPYMSPIDNRVHRYFPDVVIRKKTPDGKLETIMIEIKPKSQTMPPHPSKKNATKSGRVSRRYINEVKTYGVNEAKWKAAERYCTERGWRFQIMTEDHLGVK